MRFGYRYRDIKYDNLILRVYRWLFGYVPEIGFRLRSEHSLRTLGTIQGNLILDAGCGAGVTSLELARRGARVIGIDLTLENCKRGMHASNKVGFSNKLSFIVGDLCYLPFRMDFFDSIICLDVLEHIKDDKKACSEFLRVLKPTGKLLIHVPYCHCSQGGYDRVWNHFRAGYQFKSIKMTLGDSFFILCQDFTQKRFGAVSVMASMRIMNASRKSKGKTNLMSLAIFPFLYLFSKLDIFSNEGMNGLLILAKKRTFKNYRKSLDLSRLQTSITHPSNDVENLTSYSINVVFERWQPTWQIVV